MDILLDDGLCFELFETVNIEIPVIFTTTYNEYMLSAFKVNRNCIININQISDIISYSSSRLKILLKTKKPIQEIIVSKDKVSEFKKWIDK
jgi:DNA-binding LytR/AlgR family response regulator